MGIFVALFGIFVAFIVTQIVIGYFESRITKPSDGLVGLICGELRTDPKSWQMTKTDLGSVMFSKKNISVMYCELFEEHMVLCVDDKSVEISPSSDTALMNVVKPIIKAHKQAEQAAAKARELCSIIKASQDMLHD